MNFFNKALYHLVLTPAALYKRMGVQMDKLEVILQVKLMMDDRKPNTFNQQRPQKKGKPKKEFSKTTLWSVLGSAFMGLLFIYVFLIPAERLLQLTIYFSFYIVLQAFLLISEVSNLLLDGKDNTIILPTPVNPSTLLVARLLHIVIIVMRTGLPLMLGCWVACSIVDGWKAALIFPWICVLAILFAVFLVNGFYLLILRFVSAERFKNILTGVQIVFSILVFGAYQLLPRLIDKAVLSNTHLASLSWSIFFPSQWFAALYETILHGFGKTLVVAGAIMAVVFPLLALIVLVKFLAPAFNRKVALIGGGEIEKPVAANKKVQLQKGNNWVNTLSSKFTSSHTEEAAFRLTWNISSRSREFKMKVYPSLGYLLVYALLFFLSGDRKNISLADFQTMKPSAFVLMITLVYMSSFFMNTVITQMQLSEKPKAAWIFFTAPLHQPGHVISGSFKAMLAKFFLPIVLVISCITLVLSQGHIALHLLVGFSNVLMCTALFGFIFLKKFPFSMPVQTDIQTGNLILGITATLLPLGLGIIHNFMKHRTLLLVFMVLFSWVITYWLARAIQKRKWQAILSRYSEE